MFVLRLPRGNQVADLIRSSVIGSLPPPPQEIPYLHICPLELGLEFSPLVSCLHIALPSPPTFFIKVLERTPSLSAFWSAHGLDFPGSRHFPTVRFSHNTDINKHGHLLLYHNRFMRSRSAQPAQHVTHCEMSTLTVAQQPSSNILFSLRCF